MELLTQIVVAVDGSPVSEKPLQLAVHFAHPTQIPLTGIFVIDAQWADFIGNDWQSSRNARQGFLDYIQRKQEEQAEIAHHQFKKYTQTLRHRHFEKPVGDPLTLLTQWATAPHTGLLILSHQVFQVCGRPSSQRIAQQIAKKARCPVLLVP
jgi:nucleotide-binding universal stress UspA family protein